MPSVGGGRGGGGGGGGGTARLSEGVTLHERLHAVSSSGSYTALPSCLATAYAGNTAFVPGVWGFVKPGGGGGGGGGGGWGWGCRYLSCTPNYLVGAWYLSCLPLSIGYIMTCAISLRCEGQGGEWLEWM